MSEFMRIKIELPPIQKTSEWLSKRDRLQKEFEKLKGNLPVNQIDNVVLTSEDIDSEDNAIDISSYMQRAETIEQMQQLECEQLPVLFSDVTFYSPISLSEHHHQDKAHSCAIATTLNALEALGTRDDTDSEEDIAATVGEDGSEHGVNPMKLIAFVQSKGLVVTPITDCLQLIRLLEDGGVAMQEMPFSSQESHEILVSAVSIEKGKINFKINDPLSTSSKLISLDEMSTLISRDVCNTHGIEEPPEIEFHDNPEIVITSDDLDIEAEPEIVIRGSDLNAE